MSDNSHTLDDRAKFVHILVAKTSRDNAKDELIKSLSRSAIKGELTFAQVILIKEVFEIGDEFISMAGKTFDEMVKREKDSGADDGEKREE